MSNAKLATKSQTTISQKIKVILNSQVHLKKAIPMDMAYLKALESTLSEWNSENDENAYSGL
jgi:hypothetical protein